MPSDVVVEAAIVGIVFLVSVVYVSTLWAITVMENVKERYKFEREQAKSNQS